MGRFGKGIGLEYERDAKGVSRRHLRKCSGDDRKVSKSG